jgi:hypothetical protein
MNYELFFDFAFGKYYSAPLLKIRSIESWRISRIGSAIERNLIEVLQPQRGSAAKNSALNLGEFHTLAQPSSATSSRFCNLNEVRRPKIEH